MVRTVSSTRSRLAPGTPSEVSAGITRIVDVSGVAGVDGRYVLALIAEDTASFAKLQLPAGAEVIAEWTSPTSVRAMALLHGRLASEDLRGCRLMDVLHAPFEVYRLELLHHSKAKGVAHSVRWAHNTAPRATCVAGEKILQEWVSPSRSLLRCMVSTYMQQQGIERVLATGGTLTI